MKSSLSPVSSSSSSASAIAAPITPRSRQWPDTITRPAMSCCADVHSYWIGLDRNERRKMFLKCIDAVQDRIRRIENASHASDSDESNEFDVSTGFSFNVSPTGMRAVDSKNLRLFSEFLSVLQSLCRENDESKRELRRTPSTGSTGPSSTRPSTANSEVCQQSNSSSSNVDVSRLFSRLSVDTFVDWLWHVPLEFAQQRFEKLIRKMRRLLQAHFAEKNCSCHLPWLSVCISSSRAFLLSSRDFLMQQWSFS